MFAGKRVIGFLVSIASVVAPAAGPNVGGTLGGIISGGGSLGTKFVCCKVDSTSSLGGGGGTSYTPVLRDRAVSQLDALARCGIYKMYWATQSCPKDVDGGSNEGGSPAPQPTLMKACNQTSKMLYVAGGEYNAVNNVSYGWTKLAPNQCSNIHEVGAQGYMYATDNTGGGGNDYTPKFYNTDHILCVSGGAAFNGPTSVNNPSACTGAFRPAPMGVAVKMGNGGLATWNISENDLVKTQTVVEVTNRRSDSFTLMMDFEFQSNGKQVGVTHADSPTLQPGQTYTFRLTSDLAQVAGASNGAKALAFKLHTASGQSMMLGYDQSGRLYGLSLSQTTRQENGNTVRVYHQDLR